jgi:hypothetical protein
MDAGKLTPIRIGRSVRFSVDHLEGFVDDLTADGRVDSNPELPGVAL